MQRRWFLRLTLSLLGGGPFALLQWERAIGYHDRDPLHWGEGNHGPWWTSWEENYLLINLLMIVIAAVIFLPGVQRRWAYSGYWPREGCGIPPLCLLLFAVRFCFWGMTCD